MNAMLNDSIAERWQSVIKSACEVHGQTGLAELLNVSRTSISHWRNHGVLPDIQSMAEYCRILGVSLVDIVDGTLETTLPEVRNRNDVWQMASKLPKVDRKKLINELVKSL